MADYPLRPATHRRLGRPLPYQQPNETRTHPSAEAYAEAPFHLIAKKDRIQYWLDRGAQMTPSVNNLLISQEIIEGSKVKASKKGETSEKRKSQAAAKADKKKAAEAKPAETESVEAPVEAEVEAAPEAEVVTE